MGFGLSISLVLIGFVLFGREKHAKPGIVPRLGYAGCMMLEMLDMVSKVLKFVAKLIIKVFAPPFSAATDSSQLFQFKRFIFSTYPESMIITVFPVLH